MRNGILFKTSCRTYEHLEKFVVVIHLVKPKWTDVNRFFVYLMSDSPPLVLTFLVKSSLAFLA